MKGLWVSLAFLGFLIGGAAAENLNVLPPNTVVGRMGSGTAGPAEAIPFTSLASSLGITNTISIGATPVVGGANGSCLSISGSFVGAVTCAPTVFTGDCVSSGSVLTCSSTHGVPFSSVATTAASGNGTKIGSVSGTLTNGDCVSISNNNFVDAGGPCTTGGGGGTVTSGTAGQAAYYATTGSAVSGISVGSLLYTSTGSTTARTGNARANDRGINILDFGADPTGASDSTSAIQAAIDSMNGTSNRTVFCPDGSYKITRPIFLDPPGNLRGADGTNGQAWVSGHGYSLGETVNSVGIAYINLTGTNTTTAPASDATNWRAFAWNSGTTYAQNAIVSFNGVPWISLVNSNSNHTPAFGGGFWRAWFVFLGGGTNINFGYTFTGNPGNLPAQNTCSLSVTFDDAAAFYIGPGNGMALTSVNITGSNPNNYYPGQYPATGYGVCIATSPGGANRTTVENVGFSNGNVAYATACNNGAGVATAGALGAENTFRRVTANNCAIGIQIDQALSNQATQSHANAVESSQIGCIIGTQTVNGPGISVKDSNVSVEGFPGTFNSFNISSTSGITKTVVSGGQYAYFFTTTLSSPLTSEPCGISGGCLACPAMASPNGSCVYNSFILVLPHYGPVPLFIEGWNSGTRVATFSTALTWSEEFFGINNDASANTDLGTEIQAATIIYAVQRATLFQGSGVKLDHLHIEQGTCTTLFQETTNFSGERGNLFDHLRFNYEPSFSSNRSPANQNYPIFICQQSFPFIDTLSGGGNNAFEMRGATLDGGTDPLNLDISPTGRCVFDAQASDAIGNTSALNNATMRLFASGGAAYYSPTSGGCEFTWPAFYPTGNSGAAPSLSQPYIGWHASPFTHPNLPTSVLSSWLSPPTIGTYIPMDGSSIYSVADNVVRSAATTVAKLVQSNHRNFSWGQNLSSANVSGFNVSFKGQSCAVQADANTLALLFPGLEVTFAGTSGSYVVNGVMPRTTIDGGTHPGYFTVASTGGSNSCLAGTSGTVYTPSSIGQASYAINVLSEPQSTGTPTLTSCGTSPALTSGSINNFGSFTTGSSGTPTACTLNFTPAFPTNANCTISAANTAANGVSGGTYISTQSTSLFTITLGTGTNSAKYNYVCSGN